MGTEKGVKLDQGKVEPSFVFQYFPSALLAVAQVSMYGAQKYTRDGWREVPNGIQRYTDAMERHLLAEHIEGEYDEESGLLHAAQVAWNALARLELMLQEGRKVCVADAHGDGPRVSLSSPLPSLEDRALNVIARERQRNGR